MAVGESYLNLIPDLSVYLNLNINRNNLTPALIPFVSKKDKAQKRSEMLRRHPKP